MRHYLCKAALDLLSCVDALKHKEEEEKANCSSLHNAIYQHSQANYCSLLLSRVSPNLSADVPYIYKYICFLYISPCVLCLEIVRTLFQSSCENNSKDSFLFLKLKLVLPKLFWGCEVAAHFEGVLFQLDLVAPTELPEIRIPTHCSSACDVPRT